MISLIRNKLLHYSIPLQKLMQKLGKPEPKVKYSQVREAMYLSRPGDCILTREDWRLTNIFIPGYWSHAAIFDHEMNVVEAIGSGVQAVDPVEMLLKKDDFCILRPLFLDTIEKHEAAKYAHTQVGVPYDYIFSSNQAWYCSELVYFSYQYASPTVIPIKAEEVLGELSITPDHFKKSQSMKEIFKT